MKTILLQNLQMIFHFGTFCNVVFLDVAQAFDRVLHQKLACKFSKMLMENHVRLLMSYTVLFVSASRTHTQNLNQSGRGSLRDQCSLHFCAAFSRLIYQRLIPFWGSNGVWFNSASLERVKLH